MSAKCELCGEPMPAGEEMFKFHGYSGQCPKPPLPKAPTALEMIAEKHRTNREHKSYTPEHDDEHVAGELIDAAISFLMHDLTGIKNAKDWWPFEEEEWKPSDDPIRNLVAAGALIVAEIERLQRDAK